MYPATVQAAMTPLRSADVQEAQLVGGATRMIFVPSVGREEGVLLVLAARGFVIRSPI